MAESVLLDKLQSMELEMAQVLLAFCDKYDLKIWADSGTLLGAVRHGGFIPWDDDMDFVMFRTDYDRLIDISRSEILPQPYYFEIGLAQIRLCRGGTTMFATNAKYPNHNGSGNGGSVWIDIFCLDNIPMVDAHFRKQWHDIFQYDRIASNQEAMSFASSRGIIGKCWHLFCLFFNATKREEKVNRFCKQFLAIECENVTKLALYLRMGTIRDADKLPLFNRHWFDETISLTFDGIDMPCPKSYDSVLRSMYGDDYMTPLRSSSVHGNVIIDLDRSYEDVVKDCLSMIPWWKRFGYRY